MAKIHRDLDEIPSVKPKDPIYRAIKESMGKDTVYGYSKSYEFSDIKTHNVKIKKRSGYAYVRDAKIPTVIPQRPTKTVQSLSRSQNACVRFYRKLKQKHSHVTIEILKYFTTAATVKSLIKKGIFQEYSKQGVPCVTIRDHESRDERRVGKIQIRMIT
jgi:hypothetical protein